MQANKRLGIWDVGFDDLGPRAALQCRHGHPPLLPPVSEACGRCKADVRRKRDFNLECCSEELLGCIQHDCLVLQPALISMVFLPHSLYEILSSTDACVSPHSSHTVSSVKVTSVECWISEYCINLFSLGCHLPHNQGGPSNLELA